MAFKLRATKPRKHAAQDGLRVSDWSCASYRVERTLNTLCQAPTSHPGARCGVAARSSGSIEVRKDRNEVAKESERNDPSDRT